MSYRIEITEKFERDVRKLSKKHKSLKADLLVFRDQLRSDPNQGVSLGKDCYKIRLAISSKGKGKRGGGRVITCVKVVQETVYLLAIYDKSERDTVSDTELDDMLSEAGLGE
ncbi:type II toxin-antitoxin system RelE/ParE family toxin [Spirosoma sp. BT704]|uniref:Type II toxin-antitoxin system RelE/ParE family toxin n=1 Tax=Spirosoma validum TaxID=2771355 RepID=A0A927B392_9BACT|nr:type II toxin-antitoxin system RelE/ParE family toxin [Spirosoma validum]